MPLPVFILSLEDAAERRAPLVEAFQARGVPFEMWHAVDGRNGLAPKYEKMIDRGATQRNLGRQMGNAEYGCALSHHLIYRAILERDLDAAIILEDDAIVGKQFFDFLSTAATPNCDLLLLDHAHALVSRTDRMKFDDTIVAYRCKSSPMLTTGYLVTRNGAARLAEGTTPISAVADWPDEITRMRTYALTPRLVDHPDVETAASDIRDNRKQFPLVKKRRDPKRFLALGYWKKTYYKLLGKWLS
jgi:glycosyl transferase family 25